MDIVRARETWLEGAWLKGLGLRGSSPKGLGLIEIGLARGPADRREYT
jgi:hypothetical protein